MINYCNRKDFKELVRNAGVKKLTIDSSHYFGEGVFWQSIDDSRLNDPTYVDMIIRTEDLCRNHSVIAERARILMAVGEK